MKIYYKVTNPYCDSIVTKNMDLKIRYQLMKWVTPKVEGSSLMVFDNLENAKKSICRNGWKEYGNCRLFKCEVKNPKKIGIWKYWIPTVRDLNKIIKFRKQHKAYRQYIDKDEIPKGTIFCDAVKLIEEIPSHEY